MLVLGAVCPGLSAGVRPVRQASDNLRKLLTCSSHWPYVRWPSPTFLHLLNWHTDGGVVSAHELFSVFSGFSTSAAGKISLRRADLQHGWLRCQVVVYNVTRPRSPSQATPVQTAQDTARSTAFTIFTRGHFNKTKLLVSGFDLLCSDIQGVLTDGERDFDDICHAHPFR